MEQCGGAGPSRGSTYSAAPRVAEHEERSSARGQQACPVQIGVRGSVRAMADWLWLGWLALLGSFYGSRSWLRAAGQEH